MTESNNIREQIEELGPWFHNIHLPDGTQTAPDHFLGDFPAYKWEEIEPVISADLSGKTVLDIGCNAGYYTLQLARRGAKVTAIDLDPKYLQQADWVLGRYGLSERVTLKQQQVYDLAREEKQYDIIWFMGVFYHLRYPVLALDIVSRMTGELLMFQTLTLPGEVSYKPKEDYEINNRRQMLNEGWPKMAFIEQKFNRDPTNWWFANNSCIEALLRTCGFKIVDKPGNELYLCEPDRGKIAVSQTWNESEYLSAIQRNWQDTYEKKVK